MTVSNYLLPFLKRPVIMHLGTCNGLRSPFSSRVLGGYVESDSKHMVVYILEDRSKRTIDNLRETNQAALLLIDPTTYESFQIKGDFQDTWMSAEQDEQFLDQYLENLKQVSFPEKYYQIRRKPAIAIRLRIREVYDQSPGPGAGNRIHQERAGGI